MLHHLAFKTKYILTGTPLPNNPLEAYNYLKWGGIITESWWHFKNRYGLWGGYRGKELVGYQNIQELRTLLQKNMLRRLKKDKLKDLPDVIFKTIPLEMLPKQAALYKAVKKEIMAELKDTTLTKIPSALSKLLRLQQITDSPALIGYKSEKSVKLDALDELLGDITDCGEKAIVFSRFKTMVDIMSKRYTKYNPAVIHGEISTSGMAESSALRISGGDQEVMDSLMTSKRQKEVYKFQGEASCKLFLGTSGACKEGLTLTAATNVVFVDYEWNYASVEQAFSRAHRIGQKGAVTVYYLCCIGTVDEYVKGVVERKDNMSQIMLGGDGNLNPHRARDFILDMLGEMDREE